MQRRRRRWAGIAAVVRMGVSVKLADIYPSTIAYQCVDVTPGPRSERLNRNPALR